MKDVVGGVKVETGGAGGATTVVGEDASEEAEDESDRSDRVGRSIGSSLMVLHSGAEVLLAGCRVREGLVRLRITCGVRSKRGDGKKKRRVWWVKCADSTIVRQRE